MKNIYLGEYAEEIDWTGMEVRKPIEWIVLDENENEMFLVSRKGLMHVIGSEIDWNGEKDDYSDYPPTHSFRLKSF